MDPATITALAALATGLGAGPLLLKAGGAVWTALTGGVKQKRNESELRDEIGSRDATIARLRVLLDEAYARITRLLNTNRSLRIAAERNELLLERNGIQPTPLPDLDEDTDGPWSSELENRE